MSTTESHDIRKNACCVTAALLGAIIKAKPAAAKGQYIKSCVAASTMGPGVKMNANKQL